MLEERFVVDADSHWSEPADLVTRRAPEKVEDRVPHVETIDGQTMWVFDGHAVGKFRPGDLRQDHGRERPQAVPALSPHEEC